MRMSDNLESNDEPVTLHYGAEPIRRDRTRDGIAILLLAIVNLALSVISAVKTDVFGGPNANDFRGFTIIIFLGALIQFAASPHAYRKMIVAILLCFASFLVQLSFIECPPERWFILQ